MHARLLMMALAALALSACQQGPQQRWEQLRERGAKEARKELIDRGFSEPDAQLVADEVEEMDFPGVLALLWKEEGVRAATMAALTDEGIKRAAREAGADVEGEDGRRLVSALRKLVRERDPSEIRDLAQDEEVMGRAIKNIAETQGLDLSESEARAVYRLLFRGELKREAHEIVAALDELSATVLKQTLNRDYSRFELFRVSRALMRGLARDLRQLADPPSIKEAYEAIRGKGTLEGKVPIYTLAALYEGPMLGAFREALHRVLGQKSVQLAIVLYARSNGVPLETSDIEAVRASLLKSDPELGPLIAHAIERMEDEVEGDWKDRVKDLAK